MRKIDVKAYGTLLSLLQSELFGREKEINADDWPFTLTEADRHVVTALLFPTMMQLRGVPDDALGRACNAAMSTSQSLEVMLERQQKLIDLLSENNIPCVILKGMSIARVYPHPELRAPGDIDILVDEENIDEVGRLMLSDGFSLSHDQEKHVCYDKGDLSVEVHRKIARYPDNEKGDFTREYMRSAPKRAVQAMLNGVKFPVLPDIDQLISLLLHMAEHISDSGIGLRQLCDWAVAVNAMRNEIGEEQLQLLDRCGLLVFAKTMTRLCVKHLGLPEIDWATDADETAADTLFSDILDGGNFRAQYNARPLSRVLTDGYNAEKRRKTSVIRSYIQFVRNRLRYEHPWAKNFAWVALFGAFYPVRYVVRMLLGKRRKVNVRQVIQTSREREQMIWQLKLYQ